MSLCGGAWCMACSFILFEFDFVSTLEHEYPSEYFDDTW